MADLIVRELGKEYPTRSGPLVVLSDINMSLSAGQSLAIVGPSGSGKSTLLQILGGLERPTRGEVTLLGRRIDQLPADELATHRNRNIGFVFQDHFLLPQLNVLENVLVPGMASGAMDPALPPRGLDLLERVGLSQRLDHLPAELSGGERQRVALVRAMIMRPPLVLADEPTGNLDQETARRIGDLLFQLPTEEGAMLVVVTHSEPLADRASRRERLVGGRFAVASSPSTTSGP